MVWFWSLALPLVTPWVGCVCSDMRAVISALVFWNTVTRSENAVKVVHTALCLMRIASVAFIMLNRFSCTEFMILKNLIVNDRLNLFFTFRLVVFFNWSK